MGKYTVYKYTNKINKKVYIGITTRNLETRHKEHSRNVGIGTYFSNAIKKYGIDNFVLEKIDTANNINELAQKEVYWIKHYNAFVYWDNSNGYNETFGGEGLTGHSGELNSQFGISPQERMTQEKFEEWKLNLKKSAHHGIENKCYGVHPLEWMGKERWEELLCELSERWKGENNPNVKNPKHGKDHPNFGKHFSEEIKAKMRAGKKNNKLTDEKAASIHNEYIKGKITQEEIAEKYGISRQTVSDVLNGRIYKHILVLEKPEYAAFLMER